MECVPEEIMAAGADTVLAYFCRAGRAFHFQGGIARPGLFAGAALNGHGDLNLVGTADVNRDWWSERRGLHDLGETSVESILSVR